MAASGVRGEDCEIAARLPQDAERHVGHHHPGLVEVDLGHEHLLALRGRDLGIPGHHRKALLARGPGGGNDLITGVVRDHDAVLTLGGGGGDDLDLPGDAVLRGRPDELQRARIRELLVRFPGAVVGLVEDEDADELRHENEVGLLALLGHDLGVGGARPEGCGNR